MGLGKQENEQECDLRVLHQLGKAEFMDYYLQYEVRMGKGGESYSNGDFQRRATVVSEVVLVSVEL